MLKIKMKVRQTILIYLTETEIFHSWYFDFKANKLSLIYKPMIISNAANPTFKAAERPKM